MPNLSVPIVKLERSVIYQSVSILQEKFICVLKSIVRDIELAPLLGVPDLHPKSQERPPRVPDGCQIYLLDYEDRDDKCFDHNF